MTDAELTVLLRSALPPMDESAPVGDLWPRLLTRAARPSAGSRADLGVAAGLVAGLLGVLATRPDWILLLVYHL